MFCSKCGAQLPDGTRFCTQCGTSVQPETASHDQMQPIPAQADSTRATTAQSTPAAQSPMIAATTSPQPTAPVSPVLPANQQPSNKRGVLIAILAVLIVILIGIIIFFAVNIFASNENSDAPSSTTPAPESTQKAPSSSAPEAPQEAPSATASEAPQEAPSNSAPEATYTSPTTTPFYGIWIGAYTEKAQADAFCSEVRGSWGLNAQVFLSSQWTNLNQDPYWVVAAFTTPSQQIAERQLMSIQSAGFSNAYVKYSGDYKG